jgi:SAM-dependent methyltransferase
MSGYTEQWFQRRQAGARRSADIIVPLLLDATGATSVIDVGCGTGSWLATVRERGVTDILGIDGDYVDRDALEFPQPHFLPADLAEPLALDRTFDLAISVEVAEHLPEQAAHIFIASLTRLAPVVAFSAAIPAQGGTGHINLQWQNYWAARFAEQGYVPVDYIRPRVWRDPRVQYFYAQNLIVYVREAALPGYLEFDEAAGPLDIVHPRMHEHLLRRFPPTDGVTGRDAARFVARWLLRR